MKSTAAPTLPIPKRLDVSPEIVAEFAPFFESNRKLERFVNPWPYESKRSLRHVLEWKRSAPSRSQKQAGRAGAPHFNENALYDFAAMSNQARLLWLGHASFFIEIDGLTMVVDPVLGRISGLMARTCPQPLAAEKLPKADVLLLTHGHFDHLDRGSIAALCRAAVEPPLIVVPLGMSASLPRVCKRVVELDWWQSISYRDVEIAFVPSQHWHRRGMDEDKALWGGYVMRGSRTVYHSGDTGFFGGFKAIGRVFESGIDVACLPLGAYEPRWFMGSQHMAPEESLQALLDLDAKHLVGMHWGTFDLTDEASDAGPKLLSEHIQMRGLAASRFHVLRPGGSMEFVDENVTPRACFAS